MAEDKVSFTLRLPKALHDRLIDVCAAADNEVTRTGLIVQAAEMFLAALSVCPSMVQGYDPGKDKSARQSKRASCTERKRKTDGEK